MHRDILIISSTVEVVSEKITTFNYKLEFNMAQTIYAFDALIHIVDFNSVKFMREMWGTHVLSLGYISANILEWCKDGNEHRFSSQFQADTSMYRIFFIDSNTHIRRAFNSLMSLVLEV